MPEQADGATGSSMMDTTTHSPFHRGEREIQSRLGVREQIEKFGQRVVRDFMPDEHRQFYAQLTLLFVGSIDKSGRPWASVMAGRPGFLNSSDRRTLEIRSRPVFGDPLNESLAPGAHVGLLGIEYSTRRRNRLNGQVSSMGERCLEIKVGQSFGNCPQYIQSRDFEILPAVDNIGESRPVRPIHKFDERALEIISQADNFYIATHLSDDSDAVSHGADVSHRGGKPGFVRVDNDRTLTFPDFSGNYHFNTMGNILLNSLAGLLFIDFEKGDLLYLTCSAEIIWDSEERRAFTGAERLVRFTLDEGILIEDAMPIRWDFLDYSPSLEQTGSWREVKEKIDELEHNNVYRNYTVTKVESESEVITSFYLEPEDGSRIACHRAGQFLPIEIQPPGIAAPIRRTYTISNAPNGNYYRLSIKREPPAQADLPPGVASNYFHDQVAVGSTIRAITPRGKFALDESSTRPVVLLSGGVGLTPMISMLEQLAKDSSGCGCDRQVWFIHGAINGKAHAFGRQVLELAENYPCLNVYVRYSQPSDDDIEGENYNSTGYVDIGLIKSLLPFDDYEFYMCGPPPFMESLYEGLKDLSVSDQRIHYEFFGPGATLLRERPGKAVGLVEDLTDRPPVPVQFAKSGIAATWDPTRGTLLDLAESEGLRPPYSCRSGICQTCSTRIVAGDVDYLESPMVTPEAGEALICSAYPRSATDSDGVDKGIVLDL